MDLGCPRCHQPMERHAARGLEGWTCRRCAGALVSNRIEQVIEARGAGLQPVMGKVPLQAPPAVEPRVDCPVCAAQMVRHEVRGATVDTCPAHGTWYDRGELRRVIRGLADPARVAAVAAVATGAEVVALSRPDAASGVGVVDVAAAAVEGLDVLEVAGVALEAAGGVLEFLGDLLG